MLLAVDNNNGIVVGTVVGIDPRRSVPGAGHSPRLSFTLGLNRTLRNRVMSLNTIKLDPAKVYDGFGLAPMPKFCCYHVHKRLTHLADMRRFELRNFCRYTQY